MWGQSKNQGRQVVLDLLGRWKQATGRVDQATEIMKIAIASHPLGMRSMENEEARQAAIQVLAEVRSQTSDAGFGPF